MKAPYSKHLLSHPLVIVYPIALGIVRREID